MQLRQYVARPIPVLAGIFDEGTPTIPGIAGNPGDYLVVHPDGTSHVVAPDQFERTFDLVEQLHPGAVKPKGGRQVVRRKKTAKAAKGRRGKRGPGGSRGATPPAPAVAEAPKAKRANYDPQRDEARALFLQNPEASRADVARELGIPPSKVNYWAKVDGWDRERRKALRAQGVQPQPRRQDGPTVKPPTSKKRCQGCFEYSPAEAETCGTCHKPFPQGVAA